MHGDQFPLCSQRAMTTSKDSSARTATVITDSSSLRIFPEIGNSVEAEPRLIAGVSVRTIFRNSPFLSVLQRTFKTGPVFDSMPGIAPPKTAACGAVLVAWAKWGGSCDSLSSNQTEEFSKDKPPYSSGSSQKLESPSNSDGSHTAGFFNFVPKATSLVL